MTSITTSTRQTFFIAQKVAQNLVTRAKGAIVNIGSMWANQDVAPAPRRVSNELDTALARADDAFRVRSSVVSFFSAQGTQSHGG
jgi:NAD(P)-dependent dehydrogenase (short-subunit alcohol dehydrogenase family)